jgi:hypothetical protein
MTEHDDTGPATRQRDRAARRTRVRPATRRGPAPPPSVAGIHSTLLGSRGASPASKEAAGKLLRIAPGAVMAAYQNRRFLQAAVQFAAIGSGIQQFIDIGCGLILPGALHETALSARPDARVVYADNDPSVVASLTEALQGHSSATAIHGDIRRPGSVLAHPALLSLIDMTKPVAVVMSSVLQHVADDDDPAGVVAAFGKAIAPGSQLILSHPALGHPADPAVRDTRRIFEAAAAPFVPRTHAQVLDFFGGLELLPPGVVSGATWRPGYLATDPRTPSFYVGVGSRPQEPSPVRLRISQATRIVITCPGPDAACCARSPNIHAAAWAANWPRMRADAPVLACWPARSPWNAN